MQQQLQNISTKISALSHHGKYKLINHPNPSTEKNMNHVPFKYEEQKWRY